METLECICKNKLTFSPRLGEWNNYIITQKLNNASYDKVCKINQNLAITLVCTECHQRLGYYIFDSLSSTKDLIGKTLIITSATPSLFLLSKNLKKFHIKISKSFQILQTLNESLGRLELYLISEVSI